MFKRNTLEEAADIIKALIDGDEVQWSPNDLAWYDCRPNTSPNFEDVKYRRKPMTPAIVWINIYDDGSGISYLSESLARQSATGCWSRRIVQTAVKYVRDPG